MDWTYRVPKLRDWVTFYGDAFADDQISPIAYWDRSAIRGGLYFSHLPGIPKLDLRAEGVYTDLPAGGALSHGFFYCNVRYLNGYTNQGQLLASWIGREAQGAQGWANYWFSGRNRLQFNYRHQKVSWQFIPGGGTLTDVGVRSDYWLRPNLGPQRLGAVRALAVSRDSAEFGPKCDGRGGGAVSAAKVVSTFCGEQHVRNRRSAMSAGHRAHSTDPEWIVVVAPRLRAWCSDEFSGRM